MLNKTAADAIAVCAMLHLMWEHSSNSRKDFDGLRPRSRRGFARVMLKERPRFFTEGDDNAAFRLRVMYRTDRNPPI